MTARKKRQPKGKAIKQQDTRAQQIAEAVKQGVAKLVDRHVEEVLQFTKESETMKCDWGFKAQIDNSEPEMHLKVTTSFSKRVSDGVTADITDPNQLEFHTIGEVTQNEEPPEESGDGQQTEAA